MEFLFSHRFLLLLLAVVVVVSIIAILKRHLSKKRDEKAIREISEDRFREERLNEMIINQAAGWSRPVSKPHQINYEQPQSIPALDYCPVMEIVETTELSSKQYVFRMTHAICIGSDKTSNEIVIESPETVNDSFELFLAGTDIFVRCKTGNGYAEIVRKRSRAVIDTNGIKIKSGDKLVIGKYTYHLTVIQR